MPRELGEKSAAILAALEASTTLMSADDLAEAIGDHEAGAATRVRALLKSMAGRGLVHTPVRGLWCDGPISHATEGQPQPADDEPDPDDGTPRRVHRDAVRAAVGHGPIKYPSSNDASDAYNCLLRFDLIVAIVRAQDIQSTVYRAPDGQITRTEISLFHTDELRKAETA